MSPISKAAVQHWPQVSPMTSSASPLLAGGWHAAVWGIWQRCASLFFFYLFMIFCHWFAYGMRHIYLLKLTAAVALSEYSWKEQSSCKEVIERTYLWGHRIMQHLSSHNVHTLWDICVVFLQMDPRDSD